LTTPDLTTAEARAAYLAGAMNKEDFAEALRAVAQACGAAIEVEDDPGLATVRAVLNAAGVVLSVRPKSPA
jgi:DNA-binding phage protein